MTAAGAQTVRVDLGQRSYDILIGTGILEMQEKPSPPS